MGSDLKYVWSRWSAVVTKVGGECSSVRTRVLCVRDKDMVEMPEEVQVMVMWRSCVTRTEQRRGWAGMDSMFGECRIGEDVNGINQYGDVIFRHRCGCQPTLCGCRSEFHLQEVAPRIRTRRSDCRGGWQSCRLYARSNRAKSTARPQDS